MGGVDDIGLYDSAGKGAKDRKRRERLALASISKHIARPRLDRFEPPVTANRKGKNEGRYEERQSGEDIKRVIRRLVLDHDMTHSEVCATLMRDGCLVSGIAVSHTRTETRAALKLAIEAGLIDPQALAAHRRKQSKALSRDRT